MLAAMRPLPRAALTSCCLMAVGDVACQAIQARQLKAPLQLDAGRTARMACVGFTLHAPTFYFGFQWLDQRFGRTATLRNAVTKSLVGQATLFPTYTTLFILYMRLLEGSTWQRACDSVAERLPGLLVTGSCYWPVVNTANFALVPPSQRVLAVNVCAIAWNAYLSAKVSSSPVEQQQQRKGEQAG